MLGQRLKRQALQGVPDQQRRRFVELDVHCWSAATQIVIVHAGHVVVCQRIGVDQLDSARHDIDALRFGADQFARCVGQ